MPILVAAAGSVLTILGWQHLVRERRERLLQSSSEIAAESRRAIEQRLDACAAAIRVLAKRWTNGSLGANDEWRDDTAILIESFRSLRYVALLDAQGEVLRSSAGERAGVDAAAIPALAARHHEPLPAAGVLVGPEHDATGATSLRIVVPTTRSGAPPRAIEASFDAAALLDEILRRTAHGYALSVRWGGEEIYSHAGDAIEPHAGWWRAEGDVALPFGARWTVVHRPTRELARAWLTPTPDFLLTSGLLLSLALGFLAHQLRITRGQAHVLAEGNLALERSSRDLRELNEELEARVAARTAELEDVVAELEVFNASVSHDLRSPIGAILNFAAILEEDYRDRALDADGLEILARLRRSATRSSQLLSDLLRLSRAGRGVLAVEDVDMQALARESFALARAAEGEPEVEFVAGDLPPARGDRSLVGDLLVNLFGNALKYSRQQPHRRVSVAGWTNGAECLYEVADNGQGFDMRFADKLFGIFQRLHASPEIEGTGVGLAVVARIVKRHGGRVWAEGKVDGGARFTFTLPRAEDRT